MAKFVQLNNGWNADPNAPEPSVLVVGPDTFVTFYVNAFQFPKFSEGTKATLRFKNCQRFRDGPTNDEGWLMGECRFSRLAPAWGEFYAVSGAPDLLSAPQDWIINADAPRSGQATHFLFYFKDETFECVADDWAVELPASLSLQRMASLPADLAR
ncbi:hypothetical protein DBR47_20410 [Paucibacter sp. KBW04]|uniref:hypothetical protein n=1 Tax=Paucibacter sp. KBW04 TaxID=2153361 RepID=UPI000F58F1E5|nr:hypothetical protein [Paucibacter sp. KBW04]RQO55617.1 hypothetical protein DBR47_20410 [Paucibacter sp. KBW04]